MPPPEKHGGEVSIDPWGETVVEDYGRVFREFGIEPLPPILSQIPNPSAMMRRGVVFGHRDLPRVLEAHRKGKAFAVMSGIKPSGEFHLGTLLTAKEIVYFQKMGAEAFYCIADIEAYEDNNQSLEVSEEIAVGNVADILALGFDPQKGHIYRQSKENRVKDLSFVFGRAVTLNSIKAIYGERQVGLYQAALVQAGDILLPQLKEFGGPKPTVVPVGIDQDPHLRLTRDLAQRFESKYKFIPPSSTYHQLIKSLNGTAKMSKREPMSYFTLDEPLGSIEKKVMSAFTGGRATVEEQRRLGANPDICPIYDLARFIFMDDDGDLKKMYDDCKSGALLCGECKTMRFDLVSKFVKEHKRKRDQFIDKARQILEIG
jgi:tryptophanyl-tRNA synthetase